ncbi:MAG: DUF4382 domain-containing protein [Sphingobacteriales bacterium]|nr:MAG: DUF4382 domain-containing protein [Sphingobacteriales bacterium]
MFKKGKLTILSAILFAGISLVSCKKDDNNSNDDESARVIMRLTDGPANYDAVYLDVQRVEVTMEGENSVSYLPARQGVYDILDFRNGLDTLLVDTSMPEGKINQIRLILGTNNSVVVDGQTYTLNTPSAQESGLKLNLNSTLEAGKTYMFWIDFDAGKSINQTGNGKYQLKPVMRAYSELTDGRIKGIVLPLVSSTTVYATKGTETYTAIPTINGYFMFRGLPEGEYKITYDAADTYRDVIIPNVSVKFGTEVDLGTTVIDPL